MFLIEALTSFLGITLMFAGSACFLGGGIVPLFNGTINLPFLIGGPICAYIGLRFFATTWD